MQSLTRAFENMHLKYLFASQSKESHVCLFFYISMIVENSYTHTFNCLYDDITKL